MTVAFNPDYLSAGIDAIDSDDVTLATMDPMKPAVLRGVGELVFERFQLRGELLFL